MATAEEIHARLKLGAERIVPPRKKPVPAKKQVKIAKQQLLFDLRKKMINKKRGIPKEWERGFMAAVSVIEQYDL